MWVQRATQVDGSGYGPVVKYNPSMLNKYMEVYQESGRYGTYIVGYPKPTGVEILGAFSGARGITPQPQYWKVIRSMAGGLAGGRKKYRRRSGRRSARRSATRRSPTRRR